MTKIDLTHGKTIKTFDCADLTFFQTMVLIAEYITHHVPENDRDNIGLKIAHRDSWDNKDAQDHEATSQGAIKANALLAKFAPGVLPN